MKRAKTLFQFALLFLLSLGIFSSCMGGATETGDDPFSVPGGGGGLAPVPEDILDPNPNIIPDSFRDRSCTPTDPNRIFDLNTYLYDFNDPNAPIYEEYDFDGDGTPDQAILLKNGDANPKTIAFEAHTEDFQEIPPEDVSFASS